MAAPIRTSRRTWIDTALRSLAESGPDGVRIETLAKTLGVTRGGFYWHFADRAELLEAMLDTWEQVSTDEVIERVESEGGDVRDRIRRAGDLTFSDEFLPIDLAVRAWARHDPAVTERLRRVDNRRMEFARTLFEAVASGPEDAEARALLAFSLAVGSHFLAADHGAHSRDDVIERALQLVLK